MGEENYFCLKFIHDRFKMHSKVMNADDKCELLVCALSSISYFVKNDDVKGITLK